MGYYRKMPENVEGLQIAGKKFYKVVLCQDLVQIKMRSSAC